MPPKKNKGDSNTLNELCETTTTTAFEETIAAIRKDVSELLKQQKTISQQQDQIESLLKEMKNLKDVNKKQTETIVQLQSRIEELEQYTRSEDIIISGLKVQNYSYARAAAHTEERGESAVEDENLALEKKVIQFLASKEIEVKPEQISACHFLGGPGKDGTKKIIMRFVNRKNKVAVLKAGKNLKGSDVYVNEHLTNKNARLARIARQLRKQGKINQTWTRNGRVFAKWTSKINNQETVTRVVDDDDFLRCDITREQLNSVCEKTNNPPPQMKNGRPTLSAPTTAHQ